MFKGLSSALMHLIFNTSKGRTNLKSSAESVHRSRVESAYHTQNSVKVIQLSEDQHEFDNTIYYCDPLIQVLCGQDTLF